MREVTGSGEQLHVRRWVVRKDRYGWDVLALLMPVTLEGARSWARVARFASQAEAIAWTDAAGRML